MSVWCYRIGNTLIDTGTVKTADELTELIGKDGPVEHIYITHHHEDHSGNLAAIRAAFNPKVYISEYAAPLVRNGFRQYLYQKYMWGEFIPFEPDEIISIPAMGCCRWSTKDGEFEIYHVPGHSHDMTVVWDHERKTLFAADLFLGRKLRYMRKDENWAVSKQSLHRIANELPVEQLCCGHHPVNWDGLDALKAKLQWMKELEYSVKNGISIQQTGLIGPETWDVRFLTLGDASRKNMLKSIQGDFKIRKDIAGKVGSKEAANNFESLTTPSN